MVKMSATGIIDEIILSSCWRAVLFMWTWWTGRFNETPWLALATNIHKKHPSTFIDFIDIPPQFPARFEPPCGSKLPTFLSQPFARPSLCNSQLQQSFEARREIHLRDSLVARDIQSIIASPLYSEATKRDYGAPNGKKASLFTS